jgi:hypothetical protein
MRLAVKAADLSGGGRPKNSKEGNVMKWVAPGLALATLCIVASVPGHAEDAMMVNPDKMKWEPVDIIPGAESAVLSGDPSKPEPYVMEMRWPAGSKIGPHWHSNTERVTIASGTGTVGMSDPMDPKAGALITAGGYAEMPAKMPHWFVAQTPVVMMLEGIGPFDVNFVHPEDDPTKKAPK